MDVAHDHHVGRVAEDPAQSLDLATAAQVLSREGVPELVSVDPKADPSAQALEEPRDAGHADRPPVAQHQQQLGAGFRPGPIHVADQLPTQLVTDGDAAELGPLATADLEEGRLAVVLQVLEPQRAELARPHPGPEQDGDRHSGPARRRRPEHGLLLLG